jgi:hypothetical protein
MRRVITDYDSDWSPAFRPFDSHERLDSDAKQSAAHSLAFVLFHLKSLIQRNDIESVLKLLDEGLEEVFLHTDVFHLNKQLFMKYIEGNLPPETEPLHILNRALNQKGLSTL